MIGGEEYKVVIALNGYKSVKCSAKNARATIKMIDGENDLAVLSIMSAISKDVAWEISFKK